MDCEINTFIFGNITHVERLSPVSIINTMEFEQLNEKTLRNNKIKEIFGLFDTCDPDEIYSDSDDDYG